MLATPATHVGLVRAGLPAITESNQAVDFLDDSPLELYQDRIGVLDHAGTEHAGQRGPGAIITIKPMLTNCDNAGSNLQRKRKKMSHRFQSAGDSERRLSGRLDLLNGHSFRDLRQNQSMTFLDLKHA